MNVVQSKSWGCWKYLIWYSEWKINGQHLFKFKLAQWKLLDWQQFLEAFTCLYEKKFPFILQMVNLETSIK